MEAGVEPSEEKSESTSILTEISIVISEKADESKDNDNLNENQEKYNDEKHCQVIKPKIDTVSAQKNPEELCGWLLHRKGGIGFKTTNQRYFKFRDESCKLYYYSHENDLVAIGEISIINASFYFDAANPDKQGQFQIKSDGREVFLDAGSRSNMMRWLQALQKKRREYNLHGDKERYITKKSREAGGLLQKDIQAAEDANPTDEEGDTIPEIKVAEEDFGSDSSLNSIPSSHANRPSFWALNNLRSELQQAWSGIKNPGKPGKEGQLHHEGFSFSDDFKGSRLRHASSFSTTSLTSEDSLIIPSDCETSQTLVSAHSKDGAQFTVLLDKAEDIAKDGTLTPDSGINQLSLEDTNGKLVPATKKDARGDSWTMVDKIDLENNGTNPSEIKADDSAASRSQFYLNDRRSAEMNVQTLTEKSASELPKPKKFMTTLKKIGMGRRQISMPNSNLRATGDVGPVCAKCRMPVNNGDSTQGQGQMPASGKDLSDLEDEVKANREIIVLLQSQLEKEAEERKKAYDLGEEDKIAKLLELKTEVENLTASLQLTKQNFDTTIEKLKAAEEERNLYKEQVSMYQEMLSAKDETIKQLTNQIYDLDHEKLSSRSTSFDYSEQIVSQRASVVSVKSEKEDREIERLKDTCQGYELQHKFLTKEILELNDLRKNDLAKEKKLQMENEKVKAKYYQIKSKYYVLLRQQKEQSPLREGDEGQEIVNQLLQDALEPESDDVEMRLTGSAEEYDRYGFSRKMFMEELEGQHEDRLEGRAAVFERQSEELKVKDREQEASLRVKWENYMHGRGCKLQRSQELKNLIRLGVPHEFREDLWKGCIQLTIGETRNKLEADFYQNLVKRKENAVGSDPAIKQIELDLLRTLPNNKHYESIDSEGISKLRRVLLAFSEYNKVIGYCQGLNRLAAIALLFLNEEDAFWCLVAIVERILPQDYFSSTLMAAQADQRVLKDLVAEKIPKVHQILEANGVDLSLFTFNWFLTVYVDNIPTETFLHIWDTFLYEGSKVLFRFAVAFLKVVEPEILQQNDSLQLNRYLRRIGDKMINIKHISDVAFNWINPFPMRLLANKRQQHIQDIKVELSELDKLRHGIKMSREQMGQQQDYYSDDDLDN